MEGHGERGCRHFLTCWGLGFVVCKANGCLNNVSWLTQGKTQEVGWEAGVRAGALPEAAERGRLASGRWAGCTPRQGWAGRAPPPLHPILAPEQSRTGRTK